MTTEKKYKGTPGPWMVHERPQAECHYGYTIGDGPTSIIATATNIHDAMIMAASKDLLEALEDLLAGWELMIGQYGYDPGEEPEDSLNMKARAAIAKALGQ